MSLASTGQKIVPPDTAQDTIYAPPTAQSSVKRFRARDILPPLILFWVVIGIWYLVSYGFMNENRRKVVLPPAHRVLQDGFFTWEDKKGLKPALEAMIVTGKVALLGLAISIVLGIGIAIVMNLSTGLERAIFPYAVVIQTLPIVALIPIMVIWFGYGMKSRLLATVLIAIFPVITNTLFGLKSADRSHHDLFTLNKVSRWTRLTKMELPGALPAIFTGLRIAAGASVIGAIVGDFFFRRGAIGVGRLIDNYSKDLRMPELFMVAIISSLFGVSVFLFFGWLSNRVLRNWHESASGH